MIERAVLAEVARMEKLQGKKFPAGDVTLKGGRPLKMG